MNKNLLTLAVAAALAAPAIAPSTASAEAIVYGKLNVSIDYADVTNVTNTRPVTYRFNPSTGLPVIPLDRTSDGKKFTGWGMSGNGYIPGADRASRLGFKGSEDLGNGLKAIYQLEFGVNLNDTNDNVLSNSDSITYRNSFVGLAGGFGTFLLGRHDTPMKISTGKLDLFADTMADYNGTVGFQDLRADNVVAYISPSLSGFQLAAAIIPSGGATGGQTRRPNTVIRVDTNGDGIVDSFGIIDNGTVTNGLNTEEDSIAGAYSIAGIYSNGPFYASAAYESLGSEHFNNENTSLNFNNCPYTTPGVILPGQPYTSVCNFNDTDHTAWRLGLGLLDWNGFTLTGVYEQRDQGSDTYTAFTDPANPSNNWSIPGSYDNVDLWQIQAGYAFGNSMVKAMYGQASYEYDVGFGTIYTSTPAGSFAAANTFTKDRDVETWGVGYNYNFSKRTTAYALYTDVTDDAKYVEQGSEWSGFSLGMMHSF